MKCLTAGVSIIVITLFNYTTHLKFLAYFIIVILCQINIRAESDTERLIKYNTANSAII